MLEQTGHYSMISTSCWCDSQQCCLTDMPHVDRVQLRNTSHDNFHLVVWSSDRESTARYVCI